MWTQKRTLSLAFICFSTTALLASGACGGGIGPGVGSDLPFVGDTGGGGGDGTGGQDVPQGTDRGGGGQDGGGEDRYIPVEAPMVDPDAFFINDPPPSICPLDGGMVPAPSVGGTPECPDDKNRQGCPCPTTGMQAPCWPGARANRNLGACKDGTATCQATPEGRPVWGACEGYVLPTEGASGAAACECFSAGTWNIANLSPCFFSNSADAPPGSGGAVSTVIDGQGRAQCPGDFTQPAQPWSPDNLTVDCSGHFQLCYTLKAGDGANPQASDCVLARVCTEQDYPVPNQQVEFPPLASWISDTPDQINCAVAFTQQGGYGEMSVQGKTVACDDLDKVFNRVTYCPIECNDPNPPAMCAMCRQDGSGSF